MRPFAFFVGTNGSGTTLHRAIFDSHPDLSIPGEAQFVAKLAGNREKYETDGFDTARLVKDLRKQDRFENWGLDPGDVEKAMADSPVEDYPDAIRRLYALFAEQRGKSRYGDKTQANIHHLPLLAGSSRRRSSSMPSATDGMSPWPTPTGPRSSRWPYPGSDGSPRGGRPEKRSVPIATSSRGSRS